MKSTTAILTLSPSSIFPPASNLTKSHPLGPSKQPRTRLHAPVLCNKMFVPGFGKPTPEATAASNLHHFFTYTAVKIVAAQLESYNPEAYKELMDFLDTHSLNDGDEFVASLMRESSRHKSLALRILEVRSAYCKEDFEWDNLRRLAMNMVDESNTKLMIEYVRETSHAENEK